MRLLEKLTAMRRRQLAPPRGLIGLDLASDAAFALQLEPAAGSFALRAHASADYASDRAALFGDPALLESTLRALLASARFRGRRVATVLPSDQLKLMVVTYALDGQRAEAAVILDVVAERLREPLEGQVIDYVPIRRAGDAKAEASALVAIAPEAAVVRHLELLARAGLEVESLEIAATAVRRLFDCGSGEAFPGNRLVLYGERDRVHLSVLWGRRLLLYRDLDFGEDAAIALLCKSLDLSAESARRLLRGNEAGWGRPEVASAIGEILRPKLEEIAEEISMARVYVASRTRGESIDAAYVAGTLAGWRDIGASLGALCSLPVEPLDPFAALGCETGAGPASGSQRASFAVAAGLALRGVVAHE